MQKIANFQGRLSTMIGGFKQSVTRYARQNNIIDEKMQFVSHHRGLLSTTIGGLKRAITRFARQNNIPFAWQTRFHDHIIRDTDEMNRIAKYIENNVAKWEYDELF